MRWRGPSGRRLLRGDRHGTASLLALVSACGIFSLAFTVVVSSTMTRQDSATRPSDAAELTSHAQTLLDNIVGTSASSVYGDAPCSARADEIYVRPPTSSDVTVAVAAPSVENYLPDSATRFGLATDGCDPRLHKGQYNGIDRGALVAMQDGGSVTASVTNQRTDYPEASGRLGLTGTSLSFHLDTQPLRYVSGYPEGYAPMNVQALYVGDFSVSVPGAVCMTLPPLPVPIPCIFPLPITMTCSVPPLSACVTVNSANTVALREMNYIAAVEADFSPTIPTSTAYTASNVASSATGDVLPDDPATLCTGLTAALVSGGFSSTSLYNTVIIGSDVLDAAMTCGALLFDWVSQAGGYLIVLGNTLPTTWPAATFLSTEEQEITGASTGATISSGAESDPLLKVPNDLSGSVASFTGGAPRRAWAMTGLDVYNGIVVGSTPTVAATKYYGHLVSANMGAFANGRVLLTSWRLGDLTPLSPGTECAASAVTLACTEVKVLQNMFTATLTELYLSYGPAIPNDVQVGIAQTLGTVYSPFVGDVVELRLNLAVWRQSGDTVLPTPAAPPPSTPAPYEYGRGGGGACNRNTNMMFRTIDDGLQVNGWLFCMPLAVESALGPFGPATPVITWGIERIVAATR